MVVLVCVNAVKTLVTSGEKAGASLFSFHSFLAASLGHAQQHLIREKIEEKWYHSSFR